MLCSRLDGRGHGGKWIQVNVWLRPFPVLLKLLHCYLANPNTKKKFKKKKKKSLQLQLLTQQNKVTGF